MIEIRDAEAGDLEAWLVLWKGYCDFYHVEIAPDITMSTWARVLDPMNVLTCRMAVVGGNLVGFAQHHTHLTTWDKRPTCYLEDLFVEPAARGKGLGRALIKDVLNLARERGCSRLYWHTRADNRDARRLYDTFAPADDFVRYRLFLD